MTATPQRIISAATSVAALVALLAWPPVSVTAQQTPTQYDDPGVGSEIVIVPGRVAMQDRARTAADPREILRKVGDSLGVPIRRISEAELMAGTGAVAAAATSGKFAILMPGESSSALVFASGKIPERTKALLKKLFPGSDWSDESRFRGGFVLTASAVVEGAASTLLLRRPMKAGIPRANQPDTTPQSILGVKAPPGVSRLRHTISERGGRTRHRQILRANLDAGTVSDLYQAELSRAGFSVTRKQRPAQIELDGARAGAKISLLILTGSFGGNVTQFFLTAVQ